MNRLYSLCWLGELVFWLIIEPNGHIVAISPCGFSTEAEAMADVSWRV